MSIEIHAREDWTANRITLHVFASGTPYTGAQIYVDLSPEQAERLASQLLEQVKRFRELDKGVEKDLAPKSMFRKGCRVRMKIGGKAHGTVAVDTTTNSTQIPVVWDGAPKSTVLVDVQDLMVLG